jgi:hypothetical protein
MVARLLEKGIRPYTLIKVPEVESNEKCIVFYLITAPVNCKETEDCGLSAP